MRNAILTISSAAKTATSGKFGAVLKSTLFAVLLAAASMAGAVPIPGTPVPITLQTFVVMLAALMLPWKQAFPTQFVHTLFDSCSITSR